MHVPEKLSSLLYAMRTGRPVRRASKQVCTCKLMSSRAPNAPPTPPSVRRTLCAGNPRQAAICF